MKTLKNSCILFWISFQIPDFVFPIPDFVFPHLRPNAQAVFLSAFLKFSKIFFTFTRKYGRDMSVKKHIIDLLFKQSTQEFYQDFRVKKLYVFGSLLTDRFDEEKSDVDLLVEFDETGLQPEEIGELFLHFLSALEDLLEKKIDLLRNKSFKNIYFQQELDKTKILIYERKREEIFA